MPYVITEPCQATKDSSCVDVCPVACIHPAPGEEGHDETEQLFIDPNECIDCDACLSVCPVEAIFPADQLPPQWLHYAEINAQRFAG